MLPLLADVAVMVADAVVRQQVPLAVALPLLADVAVPQQVVPQQVLPQQAPPEVAVVLVAPQRRPVPASLPKASSSSFRAVLALWRWK